MSHPSKPPASSDTTIVVLSGEHDPTRRGSEREGARTKARGHDHTPSGGADRPGACSIDVLAVVYTTMFGQGPAPQSHCSIWDAAELGLIRTSPLRVTARGERALSEHGWIDATAGEEEIAWAACAPGADGH
jgi:hypothetical protein